MANVKEIRNRVKTVKNTQKITRAMKLVAAAKLRRAQDAVVASRPYTAKMREVVGELCLNADEEVSPFFRNPEQPKSALVIVLTSDRGLCGGYNSALLRKLKTYVREGAESYDELGTAVIGRKGREFVRRENITVSVDLSEYPALADVEVASAIATTAMDSFAAGEIDRVMILFNRFQSALSQVPTFERLLPLDPEAFTNEDITPRDYKYEPNEQELLGALIPQYVTSQVYAALLESVASEQGARMTAMDNATNNANDLIDSLTLQMNRARQAIITTELMEITAGSEALKG